MNLKNSFELGLFAVSVAAFALTACGEDILEVSDSPSIAVLAKGEKLSNQVCDEEHSGDMFFVRDSLATFICDGKSWTSFDGEDGKNGKDGSDGISCSAKKVKKGDRNGVELSCDGSVMDTVWSGSDGKNGQNGGDGNDGLNCSVATVEATAEHKNGGLKVTCGESVYSLWNGENGIDFDPETMPAKSVDTPSCSVTAVEATSEHKNGGFKITCGEESFSLWNGNDGANGGNGDNGVSCATADVKKGDRTGVEVTCNNAVIDTVWNGVDGGDGANGVSCTTADVKKGDRTGVEVTCNHVVIDTVWNGVDGGKGKDGSSCTIEKVTEKTRNGIKVLCGEEKNVIGTVWNGVDRGDGADCEIVSDADGEIAIKCGEKTTTIAKAMCGSSVFDPAKKFCFENELYTCNDKPYNPKYQYCTDENVVEDFPECDGKIYDLRSHYCDEDKVVQELPKCKDKWYNPNTHYCKGGETITQYGSMTDPRDQKTYKTVVIGEGENEQTWLAENLNYKGESVDAEVCVMVNGEPACDKYGRFYDWETALDVCPAGWYLPGKEEFQTLLKYVESKSDEKGPLEAGTALKAELGWMSICSSSGNGTNYFGFSVLPAGNKNNGGDGTDAYFWSASVNENNINQAYRLHFNMYSEADLGASGWATNKELLLSVRCIKGDAKPVCGKYGRYDDSKYFCANEELYPLCNGQDYNPETHYCKNATNPVKYGLATDYRDQKTYKTVVIGKGEKEQTWMAENLNYNYNIGTAKSFCYDDKDDNCEKYGRLYTWSAAVDSAVHNTEGGKGCGYGKTCAMPKIVRGVCPNDWHLPSLAEWETLFENVGGKDVAGTKLKSTSGWNYGGNGTDDYSFSAFPAGYREGGDDGYYDMETFAYFWSSTESGSDNAYSMYMYYDSDAAVLDDDSSKKRAFSVRCVKDTY